MALPHPTLKQYARGRMTSDYFIGTLNDADFAINVREEAPPLLDEYLPVAQ